MNDRFVIEGMPDLGEIVNKEVKDSKNISEVAVVMVAGALVVDASKNLTEKEQVPAGLVKELAARHEDYLDDAGLVVAGVVSLFGPDKRELVMQAVRHVFAAGYQRGWQTATEGEDTPAFVTGGSHE